ncbi:MAG: flagellar filament capping protein FliD [Lachnospiraceae bacterium]|nr:flagellar filament capping protein FliD [Lachnospiraceae bacterium]
MAYSVALNNVYNNYLTTYAPKASGRYDAHKKSELRGVYNSIVKLNKESPLSIIDESIQSQSYAVKMKENARELRNTIASLGGLDEEELLNQKTAYSSSDDIVSVKYIGDGISQEGENEFSLFVEKLAASQINTGTTLPDEKIDLPPGTYSFDVSINNMNYEFQFNINDGETNTELQEKLSRLINNSNIGLKSEVTHTEEGSYISLETTLTGIEDDRQLLFEVGDSNTSKTSGAVAYLGLDKVSQLPDNARFYLNDEPHESYSNHFTVARTFELNLNKVQEIGAEPIKIGLKADTDSMKENVSRFAMGYNEFIRNTSEFLASQPKTGYLLNEMNRITNTYNQDLNNLGISFDEDGLMQVDESKLTDNMTSTDALESLSSVRKFTNSVLNKANQVSLNPMDYVSKKIVAYKNPGKEFVTPYITSQYSGMMFNGYC